MTNTLVTGKAGDIMGIWAENRQVLIDYTWAIVKLAYPDGNYPNPDVFIVVSMAACGSEVKFKTEDDIPDKSVPCPCGDPSHWIIKYG